MCKYKKEKHNLYTNRLSSSFILTLAQNKK